MKVITITPIYPMKEVLFLHDLKHLYIVKFLTFTGHSLNISRNGLSTG
ncbi:protein of unknown function [Petrocella atlantisensis]|uniref:Uncharacterized protein n=1 Tax=Petrocella atlantisensis TaxID=2173034 RepID=A0A3P7PK64_9FIRM|nr:protein of unknown function [Petrocella atlantisensis]